MKGAAHLPHQPVQHFGARGAAGGQEGAEFLGQVDQDRSAFEQAHRLRRTGQQGGDLGIGVHIDKAAGKLVARADVDEPGVVFGAWPAASSSSSRMLTFCPLGVASE
jgi:hypothetical protein